MASNYVVGVASSSSQSIQAAINALPVDGGTVYVRPGVYPVSTAAGMITINRDNVALIGSGPASRIQLASNTSNSSNQRNVITIAAGRKNVTISGLCIDGNRANNTHSYGIKAEAGVKGVMIDNCSFVDCYYGAIHCAATPANPCEHFVISNNTISQSAYHGMSLGGLASSAVHGNTIYSPTSSAAPVGHGIYLYDCSQLAVSGNIVRYHQNGVLLERCFGIGVTANTITQCQHSGIMAYSGGYNAITGNVLNQNAVIPFGAAGYDPKDASEVTLSAVSGAVERYDLITGNAIYSPNVSTSAPAAVVEARFSGTANPYGNVVTGNNFYLQNRPGPAYRVGLLSPATSVNADNYGNES